MRLSRVHTICFKIFQWFWMKNNMMHDTVHLHTMHVFDLIFARNCHNSIDFQLCKKTIHEPRLGRRKQSFHPSLATCVVLTQMQRHLPTI